MCFIAARCASFFVDQVRLSVSRFQGNVRSSHCQRWGAVLSLVLGTCSVAIMSGCGSTAATAPNGTPESSPSSAPALSLQSTSVAFGDVTLNTPSKQTMTLTSSGTAALTISAATVTGTGFSMSGVSFPVTLNPSQTATLSIEFDPTAAGAATGKVTLTDNASPATATIGLSGTGESAPSPEPEPALKLQSTSVPFGDVTLNTPSTQTVTLTSSGTAALTISAGSVTGTGFSVSGVSFPATLNPNQTATLSIVFDPKAAGAATGTVTLTDNASPATATIALSGTGQAASYEVDLNWDAPSSSSEAVAGYDIYRAVSGSSSYRLLNSGINASTAYTDSTVADGTAYQYYVTSVDAAGNQSAPSNVFSVTIP